MLRPGDDHVVGQRLGRDAAAVVADHRDRHETAPARLGQRGDHVVGVAAGRQRQQRVAGPPVGDDLPGEDRLGADVVGDRGEDRRVLAQVDRRPRRPARAAGRGSRRPRRPRRSPTRRCRASAACRPRRTTHAARAPPRPRPGRASARAARRSRRPSSAPNARTSSMHGVQVVLLLAQERIEEARRAASCVAGCALEQPRCSKNTCTSSQSRWYAVSAISWATNGSSLADANRHSAAAPPNPMVRQPRSRGGPSARVRRRLEGDDHVVWLGQQTDVRRCRRPSAGSARLPTITGCTNSTAMWCASRPARRATLPTASSRPPRANRSAIGWQSRASRSASAAKKRAPASPAGRRRPRSSRGRPRARRALDQPVAPPVDALAGASR